MSALYEIFLEDLIIGHTALEYADVPMGVVFGKVIFQDNTHDFHFFRDYCIKGGIFFSEFADDNFISTYHLPDLKVISSNGLVIKGLSTYIEGMDSDGFNISIIGIDAGEYVMEFPNHVLTYNEKFKNH
jgi:hypothetical protein